VPRKRADAQQLLDEFDGGLRRLRDSGEYQRILDAHREHALRAE
jgi:polar amino acid transport system substrate-binding protein